MEVRRLQPGDRASWEPLWQGYLRFYREPLPDAVTDGTFARLCAGEDLVGLVAAEGGGLVGLAHLVLHGSTWSQAPYCYLEDLFVGRDARGGDVGSALIRAAYAEADVRGCDKVYWHTQEYNASARSLYDTLASRTSFVVYER